MITICKDAKLTFLHSHIATFLVSCSTINQTFYQCNSSFPTLQMEIMQDKIGDLVMGDSKVGATK